MELEYVISTICLDSVKAQTIECMEAAKWRLAADGIAFYWNTPYGDGKARARSIAASRFLSHTPNAKYLLFIDSDILFKPEHIMRIFNDMKNGYDLVGGLFAVRGGAQASSYGIDGKLILDGNIHEFEYIASGFMGITRKLLERLVDELKLPLLHPRDIKFYPFFEERQYSEREGEGIFLSEDYDFCEKARKIGVKPYIDTSIQLGHLGQYAYTLHDIVRLQEESKAKEVVENQIRLKGLRNDVAEFTGETENDVIKRLQYTRVTMAEKFRSRKGELNDFYVDNKECLYDDANFNMSNEYARGRLSPLVKISGEKVLDIGCGIGTACRMLAEQGNEVTGYDINKYTISFCEFLKKKYDLPITFTSEMPDPKEFDLIVTIDVLEHIEDLESFLMDIGSKMKSGTGFYHNEPIKSELFIDSHHPQHFDHTFNINRYLEKAGFNVKSEIWAMKI